VKKGEAMNAVFRLLKNHPFFKEFSDAQLQRIGEGATLVNFNPGQYIFREGEDADQFYLILGGLVSLEVQVPKRGSVTIERIDAGDVLGWSWLYPPHRWHFDAHAQEEIRAIMIDGEFLRNMIEEDREIGFKIMKQIAMIMEHRLQSTRIKLMEVYDIYKDPSLRRPSNWQN